jgi:hypothetical protein
MLAFVPAPPFPILPFVKDLTLFCLLSIMLVVISAAGTDEGDRS